MAIYVVNGLNTGRVVHKFTKPNRANPTGFDFSTTATKTSLVRMMDHNEIDVGAAIHFGGAIIRTLKWPVPKLDPAEIEDLPLLEGSRKNSVGRLLCT